MNQGVAQSPGGCNCPGCDAPILKGNNITGCAGLPLSGATVSAYDQTSSGTLLGTTLTDGAGNFTLVANHAIRGNNIAVVISFPPRFASQTFTLTWVSSAPNPNQWACGATTFGVGSGLITLVPSPGFDCLLDTCEQPLADPIYFNFAGPAGSQAAAFTGTDWQGTFFVGPRQYFLFAARNPASGLQPYTVRDAASTLVGVGTFVSCPPGFLVVGTIGGGAVADLGATFTITE